MYGSIWAYGHGATVAAVERGLLGTLIVAPYLRLGSAVAALSPEHFGDPNNAAVFRSVMKLPHPEAVLVAADLETTGHPNGDKGGWATLLGEMTGSALVDDEAAEAAAGVIREAAIRRAREARARRML